MGKPHIKRQVTSSSRLNDIIMLCHVSAYSETSGNIFVLEYENAV